MVFCPIVLCEAAGSCLARGFGHEHEALVSVMPGDVGGATGSEGAGCAAQQATTRALLSFGSGLRLVTADHQITSDASAYAKDAERCGAVETNAD